MAESSFEPLEATKPGLAYKAGRAVAQGIRISLLTILKIVEPFARIVLTALALIGVLVAFLFEFSQAAPNFPFWLVLGMSIGCGMLVLVLNAIIRQLSR
jgi:hypothetical protein